VSGHEAMLEPGSKAVVPSQDAMTARISSVGGPETLAGVTSHLLRKNVSNQPGPGTSSKLTLAISGYHFVMLG